MQTPPLTFTVATGEQEGTVILTLIGPLLLYNLFDLQIELRTLNAPVVILDLEQMAYMDSAGLGLLMNGYVSALSEDRKFLLTGVSERVGALLTMTHVDDVLPQYASVEEAEAAVKSTLGIRPVHQIRVGRAEL